MEKLKEVLSPVWFKQLISKEYKQLEGLIINWKLHNLRSAFHRKGMKIHSFQHSIFFFTAKHKMESHSTFFCTGSVLLWTKII